MNRATATDTKRGDKPRIVGETLPTRDHAPSMCRAGTSEHASASDHQLPQLARHLGPQNTAPAATAAVEGKSPAAVQLASLCGGVACSREAGTSGCEQQEEKTTVVIAKEERGGGGEGEKESLGGLREASLETDYCRICMGAEAGPLYRVCHCRSRVHEACLRKWIQMRPRGNRRSQHGLSHDPSDQRRHRPFAEDEHPLCEVCHAPYAVRTSCGIGCDARRVCGSLLRTWWGGNYGAVVSLASLFAVNVVVVAVIILMIGTVTGGAPSKLPEKDSAIWVALISVLVYWFLRCLEELVSCFRGSEVRFSELFCCCCVTRVAIDPGTVKRYGSAGNGAIDPGTDAESKEANLEV